MQGCVDYADKTRHWFLGDAWPQLVDELGLVEGDGVVFQGRGADRCRFCPSQPFNAFPDITKPCDA